MSSVSKTICAALLLLLTASAAAGQAGGSMAEDGGPAAASEREPRVWVHLVGGTRLEVDEVTEVADGVWYKLGNLTTFLDRGRVARIEREEMGEAKPGPLNVPHASGSWRLADAAKVERFFVDKFKRALPVTAYGQSELHNRWGFDHRNSLDVGVHPDGPEGRALIKFLRDEAIPFLTFRNAIPGVASGPHIHIGRPSARVTR